MFEVLFKMNYQHYLQNLKVEIKKIMISYFFYYSLIYGIKLS